MIENWAGKLGLAKNDTVLERAQLAAFARQIPLMYSIVIINTIAIAYVHLPFAPSAMSLYVPAGLILLSLIRVISYWRLGRAPISDARARRALRMTIVLAGVLGGAFTTWALSLFPYGDAHTRAHVVFFAGVTCIGIMVCLMQLRASALVLAIFSVVPLSIYLMFSGNHVLVAMSINLLLVAAAILIVLFRHAGDFETLIAHQKELVAKQTETQRLSDENFQLANTDRLTGLANRRRFFSELELRLLSGRAESGGLAVAIVDLDGFKPVNDLYGHAAGDRMLVEVSERLSRLDEDMFVSRLGGDEFGLLIEGNVSDAQLLNIGGHICQVLKSPFEVGEIVAQMSGSVGIAKFPESANTAELLFERADYALYHAKEFNNGGTELFSSKHGDTIAETIDIERCLRVADFDAEFSVAFQLVADVETGRYVGAEALARWNNPHLGQVPPSAFIRAAERCGLITKLTEVVFRKTLNAVADWPEALFISFNLSLHDIGSPQSMLRLVSLIRQSGIAPHRLIFEITETVAMQDFQRTKQSLGLLKRMGAQIALDDFGTGYSSLSHVRKLPLDRLKVDRSFITDIETDQASRAIVRTIVALCANLELICTVEGVETQAQLALLEKMGCRLIQGYLFSRPQDSEATTTFLALDELRISA